MAVDEMGVQTKDAIAAAYERNVDAVYRVTYSFMRNTQETEDIVQETFLRLIRNAPTFAHEKQERVWLIVTASNLCRNALKHWWRRNADIEECYSLSAREPDDEKQALMEAIETLPGKYKEIVYLYYYEGYTGQELSELLHIPAATVRTWLRRARNHLKEEMSGEHVAKAKNA